MQTLLVLIAIMILVMCVWHIARTTNPPRVVAPPYVPHLKLPDAIEALKLIIAVCRDSYISDKGLKNKDINVINATMKDIVMDISMLTLQGISPELRRNLLYYFSEEMLNRWIMLKVVADITAINIGKNK